MLLPRLRVALVAISFLGSCLLAQADDIGLPEVESGGHGVVNLLESGLAAWQAEDGRPIDNWRWANRVLTNSKLGSHIITKEKFQNFDLSMEFNLPAGGNSGVYLRGRYEVQLYDGQEVDAKNYTGAVWGQIPVEARMYKGPKVWNKLDVRIRNNTVTVLVNRKPVIRSMELKGPTKGAIDRNETDPGPILLQSLGGVRFRNILIKQL